MHADLQPRLAPLPLTLIAALHLAVLGALAASRQVTAPRLEPTLLVEVVTAEASSPRPQPAPRQTPPLPVPVLQRPQVQPVAAPPMPEPPVLAAPALAPTPAVVAAAQPVVAPVALPREPSAQAAPTPLQAAAPAPAAAPAAAPPAPAPSVATAPRFDAAYLDNPKPAYPPLSRRANEQGRVTLRVYVEATGLPSRVDVHTSSGFERLDRSAVAAVGRWKFVPARQGSDAVAAWVNVPIEFSL